MRHVQVARSCMAIFDRNPKEKLLTKPVDTKKNILSICPYNHTKQISTAVSGREAEWGRLGTLGRKRQLLGSYAAALGCPCGCTTDDPTNKLQDNLWRLILVAEFHRRRPQPSISILCTYPGLSPDPRFASRRMQTRPEPEVGHVRIDRCRQARPEPAPKRPDGMNAKGLAIEERVGDIGRLLCALA
jgi:hypothetical protein